MFHREFSNTFIVFQGGNIPFIATIIVTMGSIGHSSQVNGVAGNIAANVHQQDFDVIVIGGGFGGCNALYKLRKAGFSTHLLEAGSALGGVWHWNSYPGARVDSEMPYYQFSIPEVYKTWNWSQRFPGHEELKAYFRHVDKTLDLSRDISYNRAVVGADFDEGSGKWTIQTSTGRTLTCKFLVPATGSSYKRYEPIFPGMDAYQGQIIHAASWPESDINFEGKRVAIIGAGATGVQLVQEIAKVAAHTSVYIRNPNIAIPMGQRDLSPLEATAQKAIYKGLFQLARQTAAGIAMDAQPKKAAEDSREEQQAYLEELWARGGFSFQAANYADFLVNMDTNKMVYDFWCQKTRQRIRDPAKADVVAPLVQPYPVATKRCSLEQDYYERLDQDNVDVVGLKKTPIKGFTERGIVTEDGREREHDYVVLATGYDNMTGSLTGMGLRGKDGVDMKKRWENGVWTHLGIMARGCPNMFMIYGPQGEYCPARDAS